MTPGSDVVDRRGSLGALLVVWILGLWAPVLRVGWGHSGTRLVLPGLLVTGSLLVMCLELRWAGRQGRARWGVLVAMAVSGVLIGGAGYVYPVVVVLGGTTTAYGAIVRWPIPRSWPQRRRGVVGPVIGICLIAGIAWFRRGLPVQFLVLSLIAVGVLEFYARAVGPASKVDSAMTRVAHAVVMAISGVVAAVVVFLVIVPINLVSRLVGYSSLDPGWVSSSSAWISVDRTRRRASDGGPIDPDRMGARELRPTRAVRRRGHLRLAVPFVAVVVLAVGVWIGPTLPWSTDRGVAHVRRGGTFTRDFTGDDAFRNAPWARNLHLGLLEAWDNLEFNAALGGWQIRDVRSQYINVTDGERRTVLPDPALGDPIDVWFLGGSAAFGAGQRDQRTIPSELVQAAGSAGIPIRVHNLAVPATVNWQTATLLLARLQWQEPPDLVVLYDGANDLALQDVLVQRGMGASDRPASLIDGDLDRLLREQTRDVEDLPAVVTRAADESPDATEKGRLVSVRYLRGLDVIRQVCAMSNVAVAAFWQPELRTKDPLTGTDLRTLDSVGADPDVADWRTYSASARSRIAEAGVVDLTAVFDGQGSAIYWDTVHTNELGARIVAESIFDHVRPELEALRSAGR